MLELITKKYLRIFSIIRKNQRIFIENELFRKRFKILNNEIKYIFNYF